MDWTKKVGRKQVRRKQVGRKLGARYAGMLSSAFAMGRQHFVCSIEHECSIEHTK